MVEAITVSELEPAEFERHELGDGRAVFTGSLPADLLPVAAVFEELWRLHPEDHARLMMYGREVEIPRWQTAFERDYQFAGQTSVASPAPKRLLPYLSWAREFVDERLNGLLVNWYDAALQHYIGPHHDEIKDLVPGAPIVTVSLGARRIFRLTREEKRDGKRTDVAKHDLAADPGSVIVVPWSTNLAWKHSVPHFAGHCGRRISITLRAFR